jgi:hypothetical protein
LPPLPACPSPYHPPQTKACHPEGSDRRTRAARVRRFRPCRKGSAFHPVGPRANPAHSMSSTLCASVPTQETPQLLSHHALAHNFLYTPGWGSHPSSQELLGFFALSKTHRATSRSPLVTISFRLIFLAHTCPLTLIESYSCKKQGRGVPRRLSVANIFTTSTYRTDTKQTTLSTFRMIWLHKTQGGGPIIVN